MKYEYDRKEMLIANFIHKMIPRIQILVFLGQFREVFSFKNVELDDVSIFMYLFYLFVAAPSGETSS